MPDGSLSSAHMRDGTRLKLTIALIAGIWIASDIGYYFLLPALGEKSDYNDGPIAIALYYLFGRASRPSRSSRNMQAGLATPDGPRSRTA
ncbi:hypothetical protein ACN2CC_32515 [Mesorhizobium muleiense]|uniref:hypothetical protein n=1 Tax=Mesorhizobium muleiense TaxID=1004279 RepID=UPI003AFAB56B